jgi:hypothetical protein
MSSIHDQFSEQFFRYEQRGRGWQIYEEPVSIEPPFAPFEGYLLAPAVDDGRKETILSSFVSNLSRMLSNKPSAPPSIYPTVSEPEPESFVREADLIELQTVLPAKLETSREAFSSFLSHLSVCKNPISFELIGNADSIILQFVADPEDSNFVRRQLSSYFPDAIFTPAAQTLEPFAEAEENRAIVEFGLERELFYPITTGGKVDPFISLTAALSELKRYELALCQVIFQPCLHPWAKSLMRLVTDSSGRGLFVNRPEIVSFAKEKLRKPLFATVLRFASKSDSFESAWGIIREMAGALRVFAEPEGNEFIPLRNDHYPFESHLEDLLRRQTRRPGMLLTIDELLGLVHLPSAAIKGSRFKRQATNVKPAPTIVIQPTGLVLGNNVYAGKTEVVRLNAEQRTQHIHVIGASGTGKSTFLFNCIKQDIENGEGLAVLDPHGDLIEKILGIIPEERIKDVVLVDPGDQEYSVGFNILSAHSDLEKNLLASDLVSVFQRLSTSWGDQMGSVLNNAILAFLESNQGGTIADLQRFLIEPEFRNEFLKTVKDPQVVYYWKKAFPLLTGNKSIGPVLTRLGGFLDRKPIRHMVTQKENRLDFSEIMNTGKIFLAKLAQGLIGNENAYLLGSFFVSKFQQLAMSRQAQDITNRRDFWCYCDEFHNFITPSMAQILTGARKYRFGLTLAHQELRQLQRDSEVGSAVLSNPYTRVVFRVGDADARSLEHGFSSFVARDLQNLGKGEAILRVERSDFDFNLSVGAPSILSPQESALRRQDVVTASRKNYGKARSLLEVENVIETAALAKSEPEALDNVSQYKPPSFSYPKSEKIEQNSIIAKEYSQNPEPEPKEARLPKTPRDLGRGGNQHKAIQKQLKGAAELLGYRATIEFPLVNNLGSIDLLIESETERIAVEITVTTTIDHEVGNILKCFKAGFVQIVVISISRSKLELLRESIKRIELPFATTVFYFLPEEFIQQLRKRTKNEESKEKNNEKTVNGYRVKRTTLNLSIEELRLKENAAIGIVADAMKRTRPRP